MLSTSLSATISGVSALKVDVEANSGEKVTLSASWLVFLTHQLKSLWTVFSSWQM